MSRLFLLLAAVSLLAGISSAQEVYTNFIRQIQLPDELEWDVDVETEGSQQSELPINPNGARFELWTVKSDPLTSYLLDTTYVNSYIPVSEVTISTEDPYEVIPRTRADRPFSVNIVVDGLSSDPEAPDAAKSVKLLRHVQSYGSTGDGSNINRSQATLLTQGSLDSNGTHTLSYAVTSIPGGDRTKVRGEERFSVFSLEDYEAPESQLDSLFVQIWPMAESVFDGLSGGDIIKGRAPDFSISLIDLYPDSWTYAQVYKGVPQLGVNGTIVPGSTLLVDGTIPRTEELDVTDWDSVIREDGDYTMEIITVTPFGSDRLAYISFTVERTIRFNGNVTSVE
ncbi:MAG: hypothetical protein MI807_16610 [Verrucomicrobiales bacterium]|nr:hypothetical protein [Verrucomicrobiales bacterium]